MDAWFYLTSILASILTVGLKGFQHKNVIHGHIKAVAITSYLMAAADVLLISLIIKGGWPIALTSGTGAAIGMVLSIKLHDHIFKDKTKETPVAS